MIMKNFNNKYLHSKHKVFNDIMCRVFDIVRNIHYLKIIEFLKNNSNEQLTFTIPILRYYFKASHTLMHPIQSKEYNNNVLLTNIEDRIMYNNNLKNKLRNNVIIKYLLFENQFRSSINNANAITLRSIYINLHNNSTANILIEKNSEFYFIRNNIDKLDSVNDMTHFDIDLFGSTELISGLKRIKTMTDDEYNEFKNKFKDHYQLKPNRVYKLCIYDNYSQLIMKKLVIKNNYPRINFRKSMYSYIKTDIRKQKNVDIIDHLRLGLYGFRRKYKV